MALTRVTLCASLGDVGVHFIPMSYQLLEAGLRLVEADLSDGTSGNVSVRRSDGSVLITPSSIDFRLLTELDLVEIDLTTGASRGTRRPSSEWRLHVLIYEARPDVNAVVHHHGSWSTAVAVAHGTIPIIVDESVDIGPVATAPYAPSATEELAQIVSEELKTGRNAVLLANHGTVAVGRTLREALRRAIQVERSAKIYIGAELLGGARTLDAVAISTNQKFFEDYRARPEEDEFSTTASRVAGNIRLFDLVHYGFRAGITFASLAQALVLQKLRHRSNVIRLKA